MTTKTIKLTPQGKRQVLMQIINELDSDNPYVSMLNNIKENINELSDEIIDGIDVSLNIDDEMINAQLAKITIHEHDKMRDYFIKNGATHDMMRSLFSLSSEMVQFYRNMFGVNHPNTRAMPKPKDREKIANLKSEIDKKIDDERLAYHMLHQKFNDYTLAQLWRAVNEFSSHSNLK